MDLDMIEFYSQQIRNLLGEMRRTQDSRELVRRHIAELCAATLQRPMSVRVAKDLQVARSTYRELDDRAGHYNEQMGRLQWKLERARHQKQ